jgi:hypothetical protein
MAHVLAHTHLRLPAAPHRGMARSLMTSVERPTPPLGCRSSTCVLIARGGSVEVDAEIGSDPGVRCALSSGQDDPGADDVAVSGPSAAGPGCEEALDTACGLYLNDPTAWLRPPTN